MTLWTQDTAAAATGGHAQGVWQASRVEIDSRRVRPGDLFVALKGERFDGHDYVAEALAAGAVAAVVSRPSFRRGEENLLIVEDTFAALEKLGMAARARSRAKIAGVTGSVGKTSAKEMLRLAFAAHGAAYAAAGNYNNHIGLPLSLANLPPDADFAVFEMGMNHAGEIAHLTRLARPHVAAITAVEPAHMEFFPSIEAVADAKSEIFSGMATDGIAVLNRDSPLYEHMARRSADYGLRSIVTFGAHAAADCRLLDYRADAKGCAVSALVFGVPVQYRLAAIGRHWALTSLLALAVAHVLGLDISDLGDTPPNPLASRRALRGNTQAFKRLGYSKTAEALAAFRELEGRGRVLAIPVSGGEAILVDDSYNASPAAMRAAFAKTAEVAASAGGKGRRLAALGDMLELGPEAALLHGALAPELVACGFERVFTAGALTRHLHEALPPGLRAAHAGTAMELLPLLRQELRPGDILLVKGSHGSGMYALAGALTGAQAHEGRKHAV